MKDVQYEMCNKEMVTVYGQYRAYTVEQLLVCELQFVEKSIGHNSFEIASRKLAIPCS